MNEPPKFKWKALIIVLVGMLIIFIGVAVSAVDMKKFGYFVKVGGAGIVFGVVKWFFDNWKRMVWENEDDDAVVPLHSFTLLHPSRSLFLAVLILPRPSSRTDAINLDGTAHPQSGCRCGRTRC